MGLYCCEHTGCDKTFASKFSMKRHLLLHDGKKNFKCKFCSKTFVLHQYLKEHVFTHTGAKPYHCKFPGCNMSFRQAGKLSIHKKTHSTGLLVPTPDQVAGKKVVKAIKKRKL